MITLQLKFDLRAPVGTTPPVDLARTALAMTTWADEVGFAAVRVAEHHGTTDNYLASSTTFAAALAAVTTTIRIRLSAFLLPLHHPLRAAEDLAMLDIVSEGRSDILIGAGYRSEEFDMFQVDIAQRGALVERGINVLRAAWTGEPFEFEGQQVRVTPRPYSPDGPELILGGSSRAAAKRAAMMGLDFDPTSADVYDMYREERASLGLQPPPPFPAHGPAFLHVTHDVEDAWERILPHALHETNQYAAWLADAGGSTELFGRASDRKALMRTGQYKIVTPDQCLQLIDGLRPHGRLTLHPLMSGLDPELGWSSLRLFEREVLPYIHGH